MAVRKKDKTRRLNVLVSESFYERLSRVAEKYNLSKSSFVRRAVERELEIREAERLEHAAAELASLYETDQELTAFTALDGEDFA